MAAFEGFLAALPEERSAFIAHSQHMREEFARLRRGIPLLHRSGGIFTVNPRSQRLRVADPQRLPKFGPYKIAAMLPFPDELPVNE